jgi:Cu/Ag efflux pump CusA
MRTAVSAMLVGTFVFFPLFGFSINTLSMFGLVLAIGLVVDDGGSPCIVLTRRAQELSLAQPDHALGMRRNEWRVSTGWFGRSAGDPAGSVSA